MTNNPRLSIHMRVFNDRVRAMNQTQSQSLVLSAAEARSLHADLFNLLSHIVELEAAGKAATVAAVSAQPVDLDGGRF